MHEIIPWAGHVNYAASKGAVMLMMKSIAQEVAAHRIRVNSIGPGAVRTSINRPAWETQEAYDKLMELVPYNRIGEPEEVANVVRFLLSDEASLMVGAVVAVDGGVTATAGTAE